ncbi:TolC family protein [Paraglaciecola sp.]|uniref:TolC family protein n=1 Tax=Paraglaciecola sp. TaxID=1920173 RepID=UPI0030F39728
MNTFSLDHLRGLSVWALWAISIFANAQSLATVQTNNIHALEIRNEIKNEISLESAIKHMLANAPERHEFTFKQKALEGEGKTASLKPALNAAIEIENVLGTGELSGIKNAELTLSLSSVIELGDKIRVRAAVVNAKSTLLEAQKRVNTLDLLAEVTRRYIDVLAQQALLEIQKQAETLARHTYQAVTKRVNAGASHVFEQKRASSALARAQLEVLTAQQSKQSMINSLAIMWGEQSPTFTQVTGDLFALPPSPSLTVLFANVLASENLTVYAQESRVQQAQARLIQTANEADLTWTAGIRRINGINDSAFVAGLSMPLFSGERNLGEFQQQKALIGQLEQQKQAATLNFYHQLNMALLARNNALLNVQTLQSAIIPPLEEALVLVEQAYIDGRFSYVEWISTRQELLNAKQMLIQAAKQAHQRGADIESLTAQPLVNTLNSSLSSHK